MDCRECNNILPLFVDASFPEDLRRRIEQHLSLCEACRDELGKLRMTLELVRRTAHLDAPQYLTTRIMAQLEHEPVHRPSLTWWGMSGLGLAASAVVCLLALVLYRPIKPSPENLAARSAEQAQDRSPAYSAPKGIRAEAKKALAPERAKLADQDMDVLAKSAASKTEAEKDEAAPEEELILPALAAPAPASRSLLGAGRMSAALESSLDGPSAWSSAGQPDQVLDEAKAWSGDYCRVDMPQTVVVRNPQELQQLGQRAQITNLDARSIHWDQSMIGIIFLGNRPGEGYRIQITAIENQAGRLLVSYQVEPPATPDTTKSSRPYRAMQLPRSTLPVEFKQE